MNNKFRVWDKASNAFFDKYKYGYAINDEGNLLQFFFIDKEKCVTKLVKNEDFIVQHFTGLHDTNHNDIYEGDIVKTTDTGLAAIFGDPKYTNGEIKWLCEAWKICQHHIGASYLGDYCSDENYPAELEIVGNILETPELKSKI
jgi:uncharacterized phage protein (TIGR01671 family)